MTGDARNRTMPIVPGGDAPPGGGGAATAPAHLPPLREEDLHDLLVAFYATVARDELLAPYFASVDMPEHMPRIVAFWSSIVFHTGRYAGNAFLPHERMPGLSAAHFARWVGTFEATVGARFAGPAADFMKELGHRIAFGMQVRLGISPGAAVPSPHDP